MVIWARWRNHKNDKKCVKNAQRAITTVAMNHSKWTQKLIIIAVLLHRFSKQLRTLDTSHSSQHYMERKVWEKFG